jgi:hypothetical protein
MSVPTNRQEFKDWCLRKLGAPVLDINVDDEQVDDCVDEALRYYQDYHTDGSERVLYKHIITTTDITNGYITIPQTIIGINNILPLGQGADSSNMFSVRYQMMLNDFFNISTTEMLPYVMAMTHIANFEDLLVGSKPIRYNRHVNKLHIDMDWQDEVVVGNFIIVDCYSVTDPETYSDVWGDRWLARYAVALIQQQWGRNLTKFTGMQLPGGVQFNGDRILNDAREDLAKLEEQMIRDYGGTLTDMIG